MATLDELRALANKCNPAQYNAIADSFDNTACDPLTHGNTVRKLIEYGLVSGKYSYALTELGKELRLYIVCQRLQIPDHQALAAATAMDVFQRLMVVAVQTAQCPPGIDKNRGNRLIAKYRCIVEAFIKQQGDINATLPRTLAELGTGG